ncbi:MAG: DUF3089 domain-containing protein [Pseudomonadota bacterium]
MKRLWIIGGALLLVAWFGLKDVVYTTSLQANTPASATPLDYSDVESWAAFPDTRPPGAWEKPWGVDVFLIGPPTGIASGPGLVDARSEEHQEKFDESITTLSRALPRGVPIYAPHYHAPSAADTPGQVNEIVAQGIQAAFDQYFANENRDRAILLAIDERALPYSETITTELTSDTLAERFAGRVVFGILRDQSPPITCNPSLGTACDQAVDMQSHGNPFGFVLPRLPGRVVRRSPIDPDGTAEAIRVQAEQVSTWLDTFGPKPAEPLGSIQEVAIVPIRRPGEVDPDQSEDD